MHPNGIHFSWMIGFWKVLKYSLCIFLYKYSTPYCDPTHPPLIIDWTWIHTLLRMREHKFPLPWPNGSWDDDYWKFLKIVEEFLIIFLKKRCGHSLLQLWIHFAIGCFMQSFVDNGHRVLKKLLKCLWFTDRRQTEGQTDAQTEIDKMWQAQRRWAYRTYIVLIGQIFNVYGIVFSSVMRVSLVVVQEGIFRSERMKENA